MAVTAPRDARRAGPRPHDPLRRRTTGSRASLGAPARRQLPRPARAASSRRPCCPGRPRSRLVVVEQLLLFRQSSPVGRGSFGVALARHLHAQGSRSLMVARTNRDVRSALRRVEVSVGPSRCGRQGRRAAHPRLRSSLRVTSTARHATHQWHVRHGQASRLLWSCHAPAPGPQRRVPSAATGPSPAGALTLGPLHRLKQVHT